MTKHILNVFKEASKTKVSEAEEVCKYAMEVEETLAPFQEDFDYEIAQGETLSWEAGALMFSGIAGTYVPLKATKMGCRIRVGKKGIDKFLKAFALHLELLKGKK